MLRTILCDLVGIRWPIIQAGMGPYRTENLAIAAANAGILGIISTSGIFSEVMGLIPASEPTGRGKSERTSYWMTKQAIRSVMEATQEAKGIFGINCLVSSEVLQEARDIIRATLEARQEEPEVMDRLRVIITSAGDPMPWAEVIKPSGVKWFHVVPSVRHAQRCQKAGVDVIIASGHEGGGHTSWEPVHSMVLLPAVARAVNTPVVGTGGFCDGGTLVAALALGACGIQMGTRLIATRECEFVQPWKNRIVKSGERDTLVARGYVGPMRFLKNEFSIELAELTLKKLPRMYLGEPDVGLDPDIFNLEQQGTASLFGKDYGKALFLGGEVVGRIEDIPTVKELITRIVKEAEEIIFSLPRLVESQ
jgi:NAD(P)H-dependent flavin oxidoreductase YrpB (nitropropane dioxygenase family)